MKKVFSLSDPVLGQEEKQALCEVIESGWVTMGEKVAGFEKAFAKLHGANNAVAVCSCTAGLHLCLNALNIGPGDEVLVPSLTFVATVNAVLYAGATPVFVDIQSEAVPHLSFSDAEAKCTAKTKAIIVMHYGGYIVDLANWRSFAESHGLILIEDAAHAPGVEGVGRVSHAAVFSFFANKNMTTAEGGMVLARETSALELIRRLRSHGMTTGTLDRYHGHAYSYDVTCLGYNYRMDELRAAVGLLQLERLPEWNARRRRLTESYREALSFYVPELLLPFNSKDPTAAHLMPVLLPIAAGREKIMHRLFDAGVQTSIHYPPVHLFSFYRKRYPGIKLQQTENFCSRELTLPLHQSMAEADVEKISRALREAILNP
jgi:dTDP-4-amino-4,6-dideoxygalactose transaminase